MNISSIQNGENNGLVRASLNQVIAFVNSLITYIIQSALISFNQNTLSAFGDFSFAAKAGYTYIIDGFITGTADGTGAALELGFIGSGNCYMSICGPISSTTVRTSFTESFNTACSTGFFTSSYVGGLQYKAVLQPDVNQTISLGALINSGHSFSLHKGSFMQVTCVPN